MKDQKTIKEALKDHSGSDYMVYLESETESDYMAGKTSEAKKRAVKKYNDKHMRQVNMRFSVVHDADILKKLDEVPSKQGYIKQLIREDIQKEDTEQGEE